MRLVTSQNLTVGGTNTVVRYSLSSYLLQDDMVLFRVLFCQDSTLLVVLLHVIACPITASSRFKHDKGAPWLNAETLEAAGGSVACYCLSNYLIQGHRVTLKMTRALFRG